MLSFSSLSKLNIEFPCLPVQLSNFRQAVLIHRPSLFMFTIIESIRGASSVQEVSNVLDLCWHEKMKSGSDCGLNFLSELRTILNQIDPIDVADAAEWANIQHARVYLHCITAKQSSQAT